jgi:hypothetical protein
MKKIFGLELTEKQILIIELTIIFGFAIIPAFASYPFRINIFLSYEGAYRMYLGQMPFKDFGIPVGYGYWIVPFIFFKIFGPYMGTLVKAQVFINIISGLGFRSILNSLKVDNGIRLVTVFLFVISYSFFNFWPWYNHTVIVYEIVGLAFLFISFRYEVKWKIFAFNILAALFLFLSFFTKQDGGFFAVMIGGTLALYQSIIRKSILPVLYLIVSFILIVSVFILPLLPHDFLYWFNYGQPPHYGRMNLYDIIAEFFDKSLFLKFYVVIVLLIVLAKMRNFKEYFRDQTQFMFFLLTFGVLVQAAVLQVTSYTPPDGNIYFHSFAFVFILSSIPLEINYRVLGNTIAASVLVFVWWSGTYWKYTSRIVQRILPQQKVEEKQNVISISTYKLEADTIALDKSTWKLSGLKAFDPVYMPIETNEGIKRIQNLDLFKNGNKPKVLNMSELTPLAHELGFELEKNLPLWYHMNVGMFDRELKIFTDRIENEYYDLVIFEIIPNLNNFYPTEVHALLKEKYEKIDTFQAPRRNTLEVIEVYVRKKN